jgi:predicted CxxxxCH...CXXCH cytochrome family protein
MQIARLYTRPGLRPNVCKPCLHARWKTESEYRYSTDPRWKGQPTATTTCLVCHEPRSDLAHYHCRVSFVSAIYSSDSLHKKK